MTDLISLLLTLRPAQPQPEAELPPWWGRAAHALLLNVARQYNPALAENLHTGSELRPFTASSLLGAFPRRSLQASEPYRLRFTALSAPLCQVLEQAIQPGGPLAPGSLVELDYIPFFVETAQTGGAPWTGATTYAELSATLLLAQQPAPQRLTFQLTSPTSFRSGGKHIPFPMPELAFGSLLEKWNAFAPIVFPPEARRYAAECLAVARYEMNTRSIPAKGPGLRVGGVGQITYTSLSYDRYWMSVIGVLGAFALYAGLGAGTSQGMGQCRAELAFKSVE